MNYHPKHKSNSRTAVWIGAGVLAAVAIGAIIFIIVTLRSPMTKEEAHAKAECTAYFHNLDPETGEIIGTAGAIITITIKN